MIYNFIVNIDMVSAGAVLQMKWLCDNVLESIGNSVITVILYFFFIFFFFFYQVCRRIRTIANSNFVILVIIYFLKLPMANIKCYYCN
jgi:hypothetical protein